MSYPQLQTDGFLFMQTSVAVQLLTADFGAGFGAGALIGSPDGLRGWNVKIAALPDSTGQTPAVEAQTRAAYLWSRFQASKAADNEPFWIHDLRDGKFYLAAFVDHLLSYDVFCSRVYSTGLALRQERVRGVISPVPDLQLAILDETGLAILDETGLAILDEGALD
jgi:hypothetical protein